MYVCVCFYVSLSFVCVLGYNRLLPERLLLLGAFVLLLALMSVPKIRIDTLNRYSLYVCGCGCMYVCVMHIVLVQLIDEGFCESTFLSRT